jgi:hypothetical protein
MGVLRADAPESLPLTGVVFGMLHTCPHACGRACPLFTTRQVDLLTTFFFIKSLSRADKLWMIRRYENCPIRLGVSRRERRLLPRHPDSHGFDRKLASGI